MIETHAEALIEALQKTVPLEPEVDKIAQALLNAFTNGKKLLTAGNGGSAAEAAHLAEEMTGRFWRERQSLPGLCLSIDGTVMSCIINDYGADKVFSRQVEGLGQPGDVLAIFSTSGNSQNLILALTAAKTKGLVTVAFLGKGGGKTKGLADIEVIVPSENTMRVQEVHQFLLHMVCEKVERVVLKLD
jgi:D-sedoheptulose 7-phosphate isomerase